MNLSLRNLRNLGTGSETPTANCRLSRSSSTVILVATCGQIENLREFLFFHFDSHICKELSQGNLAVLVSSVIVNIHFLTQ